MDHIYAEFFLPSLQTGNIKFLQKFSGHIKKDACSG